MNTPAPVPPNATPQTAPAAAGIAQSLITGYLAFKGATKLGLEPSEAAILGSAVASSITSFAHALAQRWHLGG